MAIVYYQSALRLKPGFADAYVNMASALVAKGQVPEAMDCYMQALRSNPGLVDAHNNLGDLWRAQVCVVLQDVYTVCALSDTSPCNVTLSPT
jgi:tetratricopeptide (TPR) repeat protein